MCLLKHYTLNNTVALSGLAKRISLNNSLSTLELRRWSKSVSHATKCMLFDAVSALAAYS